MDQLVLGMEARASRVLGKHSTNAATFQFPPPKGWGARHLPPCLALPIPKGANTQAQVDQETPSSVASFQNSTGNEDGSEDALFPREWPGSAV